MLKRGLAAAAFVQKILCFFMVGGALIGAVAALVGGNAGNFLYWLLVIGIVLYLVSGGQRRGLSKEELEEGVFGSHMIHGSVFFPIRQGKISSLPDQQKDPSLGCRVLFL